MNRNNSLNIVADHDTLAVLAVTRTLSTASYVTEGMFNTYATSIPTDLSLIRDRVYDRCDPLTDYIQLDYTRDEQGNIHYVKKMDESLITEEFLNRRKLATLRAKHIYYQETYYKHYLARVGVFPGNFGIGNSVDYSLDTCDVDSGFYSDGIVEYAEIMEMTPAEAYQELKVLMDSISIVKMKYFAWYRKNIQVINKMQTEEEMVEYSKGIWAKLLEASSL